MMHWADKLAEDLIARHPERDHFTCASGISPSGMIHIGNLRDIVTIALVGRALRERGKAVRLLHSWDDYDRFRKVPKNVPESFAEFIGLPLLKVPDPFGEFASYAERFEVPFERALAELGIDIEFLHQGVNYPSGVYRDAIIEAVRKRREIFDISERRKNKDDGDEARENYFPLAIYCEQCSKDSTRFSPTDEIELVFAYHCQACGHDGVVDLKTANNVKLPWKVDWAMRWRHEDVTFEPAGKDHATSGGSYEVSSVISREIFSHEPPMFQPYEFIGIRGLTGKMSGSTGLAMSPSDLLEIYQPEVMLWMYGRVAPMKQFDIAIDDQVVRTYDEFDKTLLGEPKLETDQRALDLVKIDGRSVYPVPFRQLAGFSGIVQGNAAALEPILAEMGLHFSRDQFEERLQKAAAWIARYVPEQHVAIRDARNTEYYATLSDDERRWVADLHSWLVDESDLSLDRATERVYAIPRSDAMSEKELSAAQKRFFQIVYNLIFGKDRGPRLGTFLAAVPRERYVELLDFAV